MSLPLTREPLFGVAGVQMSVSSIDDNVDRIGAYLRHIRARFPWVHLVMFSELAPLGYPALHHLTSGLRKAATAAGNPELVHLWAGTGYRNATTGPAAAILTDLAGAI